VDGAAADTLTAEIKISFESNQVSMLITPDSLWREQGILRLSGAVDSTRWMGKGQRADGTWLDWQVKRTGDVLAETKEKRSKTEQLFGSSLFPYVAYGSNQLPEQENVWIKNVTIWTCEAEGKIKGDVCIRNGKIAAVGTSIDAALVKDCRVIDGTGQDWHITPGIIDEHSHIALASVNEGTQASSAEVQEGSVIWPEDIDIYRQLSGGVTAAQLLHGSANPIGGQSALIKLRWGMADREMLIEDAPGFIKFALGENVKQSNWGDNATERFPQTRMGVEQVYYDHFIRAREYGEAWKAYSASSPSKGKKIAAKNSVAPRRDLELDALLEILEKKRFITCHSYVQSEINMLMHVADSLGFTINTFTHILEGYKLADKMKEHGAGGSTFSDWWAYKMEVKDAIPYNAALMHEMGVTVAINSDDAEMARRLNQEAAKAVKYGGVSEEEALKMVTLNPAKLLHLDQRMGSIKVGKDADVVLWSTHPLSIYADVQYTYIDGKCFYSKEQNAKREEYIQAERTRLINKMMDAKNGGEATQTPSAKHKRHFHCDTEDQSSTLRLR
jgi:imidazolonepropionase-like amidohydrolase